MARGMTIGDLFSTTSTRVEDIVRRVIEDAKKAFGHQGFDDMTNVCLLVSCLRKNLDERTRERDAYRAELEALWASKKETN